MDIRMPELDGLEATRRIVGDRRVPGTRIPVLTTFDLDEYVFGALHAQAIRADVVSGHASAAATTVAVSALVTGDRRPRRSTNQASAMPSTAATAGVKASK
jgi:DNA-binding NarL/FixJ family response regulator